MPATCTSTGSAGSSCWTLSPDSSYRMVCRLPVMAAVRCLMGEDVALSTKRAGEKNWSGLGTQSTVSIVEGKGGLGLSHCKERTWKTRKK
jgi:hypothetical protein